MDSAVIASARANRGHSGIRIPISNHFSIALDRQNDLIVLRVPSARANVGASASALVRSFHVFWAGRGLDPLDLVVFSSISSDLQMITCAAERPLWSGCQGGVFYFQNRGHFAQVLFLGSLSRIGGYEG